MPAGPKAAPMGNVPERVSKDVKPTGAPSAPDAKAVPHDDEALVSAQSQKDSEPELEEGDLEEIDRKIPYGRFKEVNEKAKSLQDQLKAKEQEYQSAIKRADEDAEIRIRARLARQREEQEVQTLDDDEREKHQIRGEIASLKRELEGLKVESDQERLQRTIGELKRDFPDADDLAVLGWAKSQYGNRPSKEQLEALMSLSHERANEFVKAKFKEVIERKKQKAKSAIPTRDGGVRLRVDEKPKNVKEAYALYQKYYGGKD